MVNDDHFRLILKLTSPITSKMNPNLRVKIAQIARHPGIQTLLDPNSINLYSNIKGKQYLKEIKYFDGTQLLVDINEMVGFRAAVNGKWDLTTFNIVSKIKKNNTIFIDIGAHIGTTSIPIANLGIKVISFEPNLDSAQLLIKNILKNNIQDIILLPLGLGSKKMSGKWKILSAPIGNIAGSTLITQWNYGKRLSGKRNVFISTLDECLLLMGLMSKSEDLIIKIDVEGFERDVMSGGTKAIRLHRPVIVFENNPSKIQSNENTSRFHQIFSNYEFYSVSENGVLNTFDLKIRYENAVAIPKEKIHFFE